MIIRMSATLLIAMQKFLHITWHKYNHYFKYVHGKLAALLVFDRSKDGTWTSKENDWTPAFVLLRELPPSVALLSQADPARTPIDSSKHSCCLKLLDAAFLCFAISSQPSLASLADLCAFAFSNIESQHCRVRHTVKLLCILVSGLTCTRLKGCADV